MCLFSQISLVDFYFPKEYLKAAVLVSLLSVWVLVGLFYYLNLHTRRRYFTIWTAAWLFYALWITLSFGMHTGKPQRWLLMLEQSCIGIAAVFLFWGSQRFLGERVRQRLIGWFLGFLVAWSYVGAYHLENPLQSEVPLFALIGLASLLTARSFLKYRRKHPYLGATLLTVGFALWGVYMAAYPFLKNSEDLVSLALFISAVIQLLVAVSMIILVLEESRSSHQLAIEQIHLGKREREVLQSQFASSEERYRNLFNHAGEAIVIAHASDLRILELNHAAEHLLGISHSDPPQHSLPAFCPSPSAGPAPLSADEWFHSVRKERPLNLRRRDGGVIPVEIDGTKMDFGGQPCYQFFVREVTERTRLEQQLRQAEKLSALGQMISGVAHELNNPLAVIKGYLELILSHHELPARTRSDLEKVAKESERAAKLVGSFLSFARGQSGHREMVNLNEVIQRVADLRKFDFSVAGATLDLDLDPNLPRTRADRDEIQQVFVNLINNSLQAMADIPGHARLKVQTKQKDGLIQVVVEDNGPGVPPDLLGKIFEPFFTTKQVGTGTGLGLSIAHSIMTDHKGRIVYQQSSLGGAGFLLEFPILSSSDGVPASEDALAASAARQSIDRGTALSRILVLDDEKELAEMLCEMLQILGHKPSLCHSSKQALDLIGKTRFDLIISDFRMPELNGQQFYELATRRFPELASRIVFITGDVINEETRTFLGSTGNPHIGKPFSLDKIKSVIAEVLNANASRVEERSSPQSQKSPPVAAG